MDKTATVNTICPHSSPAVKGTEPIAAWTVALGQYAIMQNKRSDFSHRPQGFPWQTHKLRFFHLPTRIDKSKLPRKNRKKYQWADYDGN